MEDRVILERHGEQLRSLFEKDKITNKRVDELENKVNDITDLKIAINTMALSMEHIVEHNKKQDALNEKQNATLENMNKNLNELNKGQRNLNNKVEKLEKRVDDNENKHMIDLRDIQKKKYTDIFFKYVLPTSGGLILLMKMLELWKG